jgi:actin-related protein
MFPGTVERMEKEIAGLVHSNIITKIIDNSDQDKLFAAWHGGSILSTLGPFKTMWTTKNYYEEQQK